jgi:DNA-directed RNA polymerase subunit RPC12/RpoP
MIITCPQCRKRYKISRDRAAAVRKPIQCPACKGKIILAKALAAPKPSTVRLLKIECRTCKRIYRIPETKIPAGKTRARCKACGQGINLTPYLKGKKAAKPSSPGPADHPPAQPPQPTGWSPILAAKLSLLSSTVKLLLQDKHRRLATVAFAGGLVVVAAILIYSVGAQRLSKKSAVGLAAPLPDALNPVAGISLDLPRLTKLLAQQAEKTEKAEALFNKLDQLKRLKIDAIEIFIFPDAVQTAPAAVALRGGEGIVIKDLLSDANFFGPYVEKIAKGRYRFKKQGLPEQDWGAFPVELYELRLIADDCLIAPRSFFERLPQGRDLLSDSPAARFSDAAKNPNNIAALSIRFPGNFSAGWEQKLAAHPVIKQTPQMRMVAGLGVQLIQQLSEPFKQLDFMALGLQINDDQQRQLTYAHQFKPEINGIAVYQAFQKKNADSAPGVLNSMVRLLEDPRLKTGIKFHDNRLTLNIGWHKIDDKEVLTALSEATIGQLFTRSAIGGGGPTRGQVKTIYADPPRLVRQVDEVRLKQELPNQIGMGLFPDNFWQEGDDPHMTVELDPVAFPNAMLAKAEYEIVHILSTNGRNIHRLSDQQFKAPLNLGGQYSSRIRLDVAPGTQSMDLGTVRLGFKLTVPTVLHIFEFNANDLQQTEQRIDGVRVVVDRIEKDIAQVNTQGADDIWLFAYDRTGGAISAKESIGSTHSKFVRFSGVIDKLQIVVALKMLNHAFEIDAGLNGGRKLELSHAPQVPPRVRWDFSPLTRHVVFTAEELDEFKVEWIEDPKMWTQGLKVKLPKGPFSGKAQWETHFFGADAPRFVDGMPMWSGDEISYSVDREEFQKANAAFGKVRLRVAGKIETLHFPAAKDRAGVEQGLSTGQKIQLAFNQNEISYQTGNTGIIQVRAYDSLDRRLKMDAYSTSRKGDQVRYFWGIPARVEMDVVTQSLKRVIDFDLRPRPVDPEAYEAFKRQIARQHHIVRTLKQLYQVRRKTGKQYGEDLAGFYYLSEKNAAPIIKKAVALSDPKGQIRFGYEAQAYKGYHFTVLPKSRKYLAELEQARKRKGMPFTYNGRTIKALPTRLLSDLAAIPADKSQPAFFINWGRVYMKRLNGQSLTHIPNNYNSTDWKEVIFIEG